MNMNLIIPFFLTALFLTNCANQSNNAQINEKPTNNLTQKIVSPEIQIDIPSSIETNTENIPLESSIKNTKGLIVLSEKYGKNDFVRFYNDDGSLWYELIVNEETGVKKFVRKNDLTLKFETWEKHIVRTFSVAFDEKENQLRETPNGKLKKVEQSNIERFAAVEVKGDWLKVKWNTENNLNNDLKKTDFGWIKWKADEQLLIELFYFA